MALVQGHGTGGLRAEGEDQRHQSPGGGLRQSAEGAAPGPTRASRRRASSRSSARSAASADAGSQAASALIRAPRGTLVAPRAHGQLFLLDAQDRTPWCVKYHLHLRPAMHHLLRVHRLPCIWIESLHDSLEDAALRAIAEQLNPQVAEVWSVQGRCTVLRSSILPSSGRADEAQRLSFPLRFLILPGGPKRLVHLIESADPVSRCEDCGRFYKYQHDCSVRRRDFYFHHIHAQSSQWWQPIKFFPLGSHPRTERLFVTYDVETYTWMGSFGKQLVPFLLVMKISGHPELVEIALQLARELHWDLWRTEHPDTFFCLNPQKQVVGKRFREYRDRLQLALVNELWKDFCAHNPVEEWSRGEYGIEAQDLCYEQLQKCPLLKGSPRFIELYVVGHNINGFDEIVLAAQVINHRTEVPGPFKLSRNFMPRAGKILFNDLTYALPNPRYKKRTEFQEWEQGICGDRDFQHQFVKVMVRDTFALTHTSLRKAAAAYSLPVEKGCCPYQAVNEFYMLGSYRADTDGFPLPEYWKDAEEHRFNRELWKQSGNGKYDIVQETLDYCALDVLVTASLVQKLQDSYSHFISEAVGLPDCHFNIFQRPTISSNSHAIFRQIVFRAEKPQKPQLSSHLLAPSHELYDYVRASIRGGRCYPTYMGVLREPLYVYDICGMYASALTHPMPWGAPLSPYERALAVHEWEKALSRQEDIDYFHPSLLPGIFTIDADPPDESMLDVLPPFCSRKGGRLCWTNEPLRGEVATSIDVITLHNRGWGVRLVPDERTTVFPGWKCVAREYVQLNIAAKEKADREKNQTQRSIAKLLSNALYGSFATKLDNKQIVFSDQMGPKHLNGIAAGTLRVKSSSYIETDNLSAQVMPEFARQYSPDQLVWADSEPEESDEEGGNAPFYTPSPQVGHVNYTFKPITFLDADEGDMCLHTLEKTDPLVENDRYPSHIASFVLAWTRAFVSEWADFLYAEDKGLPLEARELKSVYGDTDSLFVTERGHRLMETRGKHRIKKNGGALVFDPKKPQLTWLVECETVCSSCGADAFSPESVFLAPKLYALKCLMCPSCKHVSKGKLRAKGHAAEGLDYETMTKCYLAEFQGDQGQRFSTSRKSLKRTLASAQSGANPFTVTETTLKRTLRPWKDKTLAHLDAHRLVPYSRSRPNPRNEEVCWMEMP
ncbi:pol [simian adenovirus 55]|uniref:DNA polymerase n=1 Tax=simian adenovirus 55 TaxID=2848082 RepID=A0A1L3INW9_9ADEN|nr:pol [Simian mastadenovirus WIV19]APG53796.1 pol [Simian mastadenovirus WIV19]